MAASKHATTKHATMGQTPPPLPMQGPMTPNVIGAQPAPWSQGVLQQAGNSQAQQAPATQGGPTHANTRKSSDQRFRSFAERYVVARAHMLTNDPQRLAEEQYVMVLDAKRFYAMIERAGQNIQPEDGVF